MPNYVYSGLFHDAVSICLVYVAMCYSCIYHFVVDGGWGPWTLKSCSIPYRSGRRMFTRKCNKPLPVKEEAVMAQVLNVINAVLVLVVRISYFKSITFQIITFLVID